MPRITAAKSIDEGRKAFLRTMIVSRKLVNCLKHFLLFSPLVYETDMKQVSHRH